MDQLHPRKVFLTALLFCTFLATQAQHNYRQFYQLRKYTLVDLEQERLADYYMEEALIPALKRQGIKHIGVFRGHENPKDSLRYLFVLYPLASLHQVNSLDRALLADEFYNRDGAPFLDAPWDQPAYLRIESTLLKAFTGMPGLKPSKVDGPREKRVYELRSYESPTEARYRNKVAMFNEGGEIALFERLGFNAVFYGEVLSGPRMPNLLYMTTFKDMPTRDSLWVEFFNSEKWKSLEKDPKYQHNVNHADIFLLYPTSYSDY